MSDVQFFILIATIVLCTVYLSNVVFLARKAVCDQIARSTNLIANRSSE